MIQAFIQQSLLCLGLAAALVALWSVHMGDDKVAFRWSTLQMALLWVYFIVKG